MTNNKSTIAVNIWNISIDTYSCIATKCWAEPFVHFILKQTNLMHSNNETSNMQNFHRQTTKILTTTRRSSQKIEYHVISRKIEYHFIKFNPRNFYTVMRIINFVKMLLSALKYEFAVSCYDSECKRVIGNELTLTADDFNKIVKTIFGTT